MKRFFKIKDSENKDIFAAIDKIIGIVPDVNSGYVLTLIKLVDNCHILTKLKPEEIISLIGEEVGLNGANRHNENI